MNNSNDDKDQLVTNTSINFHVHEHVQTSFYVKQFREKLEAVGGGGGGEEFQTLTLNRSSLLLPRPFH